MKISGEFWTLAIALLLSGIAIQQASAQLLGSDDFNGASVDSSKWGTDLTNGVGTFTQTGGMLLYTTSGTPTANDQAIHPWILNQGLYTQNWSVQLDVNLPTQTLTGGQYVSIGLAAANASNLGDSITMTFQQDILNGTLFYSGYGVNGTNQNVVEQGGFTPGLAAVQLSYNSTSQSITGYYDANGSTGGYAWTPFFTQNISAWGMTSSDQFLVAISGSSSNNLAVSSSNAVWADNFQAPATVPEPSSWMLLGVGLGLLVLRGVLSSVQTKTSLL